MLLFRPRLQPWAQEQGPGHRPVLHMECKGMVSHRCERVPPVLIQLSTALSLAGSVLYTCFSFSREYIINYVK